MNRTPLWLRLLFSAALLAPALGAGKYLVDASHCCAEICASVPNW
jgi:hypothetical protein